MFVPLVPPGIKEPHDLICVWITPRQVCALTRIAMVTGEREVFDIVRAAVLARVDVLDVKRMGTFMFLPQAAILATISGTTTHLLAKGRRHYEAA